jgi:transposase
MTKGRVDGITSVERRRRWSSAEKQQLVSASLEPGASVSAVAREAGIHPGQLYGWRRQLGVRPRIGFAPVSRRRLRLPVWPIAGRSRSSLPRARGCGSPARWMQAR